MFYVMAGIISFKIRNAMARGMGFQGRCHKEDRGSLRGWGFRRESTTPAVNNVLIPLSSLMVKSDAPDQGALMHRGN